MSYKPTTLCKERELRKKAEQERDILRLDAQREAEHHDRMVGELEKVYKERDEAREELAHLRACVFDVLHCVKTGAFEELEKAWKK